MIFSLARLSLKRGVALTPEAAMVSDAEAEAQTRQIIDEWPTLTVGEKRRRIRLAAENYHKHVSDRFSVDEIEKRMLAGHSELER